MDSGLLYEIYSNTPVALSVILLGAMAEAQERDNDAVLVAQTRAGNQAAFEQLVRRHYRAAYAVAMAICGSRADAEDVCQDALIRALERIESCRTPERFGAWLSEIVRNRALNHLEHAKVRRSEPLDDADVGQAHTTPETVLARRELGRRLEQALVQLSPKQREVVLLHDMDDWSHREIADAMGVSEVMSRQLLFTARQTLRGLLAELSTRE
jgi:RNA polymerase sigma-70 factor (ECF subfamily)